MQKPKLKHLRPSFYADKDLKLNTQHFKGLSSLQATPLYFQDVTGDIRKGILQAIQKYFWVSLRKPLLSHTTSAVRKYQ